MVSSISWKQGIFVWLILRGPSGCGAGLARAEVPYRAPGGPLPEDAGHPGEMGFIGVSIAREIAAA